MPNARIVIIGGGFGGVKCARTLRKHLPQGEYDIIVFNRENHMVFHPLLAEVAAAGIQPKDVAAPLRQLLKGVRCRTEDVLSLDLAGKLIEYESDDGKRKSMSFDALVISSGTTVNLSMIPGMSDHGIPMKTIGDALALQGHVMEMLEKAEVCEDAGRKRWYLTFLVVGGGFSGVEVAGEINDLVTNSLRFFQNVTRADVSVIVIHSRDQILPEVSPSLRELAQKQMEKHGIQFVLNASASMCTQEGVGLQDGRFIRGATVVCTIGTRPSPFIERLNLPKEKGRLVTEPDMSLPGHPDIWAIGDCAAIVNAADGQHCPPVAQFAERQGQQVAKNILCRLEGKPTKPFSHKSQGSLCSIGGHNAVAEIMGHKIHGFLAWFVWRGVYLLKLPSVAQQCKVGIEWMSDLVFPRTLAHLKADRTNRVSRAYYADGDYIFRTGDPGTDFYTIEEGEVEIIHDSGAKEEIVAVLGQGDFFGEAALIDNRPRRNSARARTDVEVVVLGRGVFTQISAALTPLRDAVAAAVKRRTSIWQHLPEVRSILDSIPLDHMIEPLTSKPLSPDASLGEAVGTINQKRLDVLFISDEEGRLQGLVTRTDLLRALEVAATRSVESQYAIQVKDIMMEDPIAVTVSDTTAIAVTTMREHGLKKLPVIESDENRVIKGVLRIENIMEATIKQMLIARAKATETAPS